eukprot:1567452-Rhodomonas_salina.1
MSVLDIRDVGTGHRVAGAWADRSAHRGRGEGGDGGGFKLLFVFRFESDRAPDVEPEEVEGEKSLADGERGGGETAE